MASSLTVAGAPYQYEVEAAAGVYPLSGERWWGSRIRWRPGITGRWRSFLVIGVHPFDDMAVEVCLHAQIERATTAGAAT